ncbi:hypothetical protein EB72_15565 [Mycobacterium sp. SWH-M1]|nr:hypothetical protein EB72_15565 [Mycobacterium sp. SWH-M1]
MKSTRIAAGLATVLMSVSAATVAAAAPAIADEPSAIGAGNPPPWVMPDLRGLVLQTAIDEVYAVSGPVKLNFVFDDTKGNRDVINTTYWTVCWQSPKAGKAISQKSKYVGFGVKRLTDKKCYA